MCDPLAAACTAELLMARLIPMIEGNDEWQILTLPTRKSSASNARALAELSNEQQAWLATAPPPLWLADDVFVCCATPHSDLRYRLEIVSDDLGSNGSPSVRVATKAEVLARLGAGLHLKASLIICDHTHIPRVVNMISPTGGHLITAINPVSVGLPAQDDMHPYKQHVENGSPHARKPLLNGQLQAGKSSRAAWRMTLKAWPVWPSRASGQTG